ncbi:expressed unknown protein [Seminavis robusta]|uniref:Uncharacterized protein n=1 Tax=Seminavis robusta TaxID=568900 RepID=A0A9N8EDE9_9STRA|nr:expressed unknown protein [Seminavis robusta]|eukprot:Sro962_g225080.1 n/a (281) ;mRNA; r:9340-10182
MTNEAAATTQNDFAGQKLQELYSNYADDACDSLLALRAVTLASRSDESPKVLDTEDRKVWHHLMAKKDSFINGVQTFAAETKAKLEIVEDRLNDPKNYPSLKDCYGGFESDETMKLAKKMQEECMDLQSELKGFRAHIIEKYGDGRAKTIAAFCGAVLACIGFIAAIALHLHPAVLVAEAAIIIGCLVGAGVFGLGAVGIALTRTDIKRANKFLANIESRLNTIRGLLIKVRADTKVLSAVEAQHCRANIRRIIENCGSLEGACQQALEPYHNATKCVLM